MQNIAILGAGASLIDDMKKVPKDCYKISVNGHAAVHYGVCDMMVYLDVRERQMFPNYNIIEFSEFNGDKHPKFWNSGVLAAWVGCQLGERVYLCGFDLFERGKPRYFYGGDIIKGESLHKGLNAWKDGWKHLDESKIIIISEALKRHF